MKPLTFGPPRTRYDDSNAEAALLILLEPERYEGARLDWAQLVANRFATEHPGRYPELEQVWAKQACKEAFHTKQPGREEMTEEEREELADLIEWLHR